MKLTFFLLNAIIHFINYITDKPIRNKSNSKKDEETLRQREGHTTQRGRVKSLKKTVFPPLQKSNMQPIIVFINNIEIYTRNCFKPLLFDNPFLKINGVSRKSEPE